MDGNVGSADGFDPMAAEVMCCVLHVFLGPPQRSDRFANLRMRLGCIGFRGRPMTSSGILGRATIFKPMIWQIWAKFCPL
jgi:hypothetical protein